MADLYDYAVKIEKVERKYRKLLEDFYEEAPDLFRDARMTLGLSQRALAEKLGVDFTYISKIENGQLKPGMPTVRKFGKLLKTGKVDSGE